MFNQQFGIGDVVRLFFREKDQSANERVWDIFINSKNLSIRTRNDADDNGSSALSISRGTGTALSNITLGSNTSIAGLLNLSESSAPENPSNGDIWLTPQGLYYRTNGATYGPLGQGSGDGTVSSVGLSMPGIFNVTNSPVTGSGTLTVAASGTSGGIPYFSSSSTLASSAALTANALLLGGGAGAAPTAVSGLGQTNYVLHGNPSGAPTWGLVNLESGITGTLPVAFGGTGGTTPSTARTGLGLVIGQDVQAYSATLTSVAGGNYVSSFNNRYGGISLTSSDVTTALTFTPEDSANKGIASGYASLDASGKLDVAQLPDLAITNTFVVANEQDMLAVTAQVGDIVVRTDIETTFVLKTAGASTLANWQQILVPVAESQISVGLSMPTDIFNVSGSPVTSEGTLTVDLDNQNANVIFAGPSTGDPAAPTFRTLVAGDIPNISANQITSGTLGVAQGGTGLSSISGNKLLYTSAADTIAALGTVSDSILIANSSGVPSFSSTLPEGIMAYGNKPLTKKYSTYVGDGTSTQFTITHNLGTRDISVTVYSTVDFFAVIPDIEHTTINSIVLYFGQEYTPGANEYRVVVVA